MVTLCQVCQKREATVFLTTTIPASESDGNADIHQKQSFCKNREDSYCASTPSLNSTRDLIRLSDSYRSKLYDLLEATHPEVFDNRDTEACVRDSKLMRSFLRKQLKIDRMEHLARNFAIPPIQNGIPASPCCAVLVPLLSLRILVLRCVERGLLFGHSSSPFG